MQIKCRKCSWTQGNKCTGHTGTSCFPHGLMDQYYLKMFLFGGYLLSSGKRTVTNPYLCVFSQLHQISAMKIFARLIVNRVSDELRVEKFFVFSFFFFFCLNPNLPFLKYASFFVQFYPTVHSNPIFFCHNSILPLVPLPLFSVFILFYRSLNLHLFLS